MRSERAARRRRRPTRLATRIALLSVGVAVLTALIAGGLATGLLRNAGAGAAQKTLGRLADVTQAVAVNSQPGVTPGNQTRRLRAALQGLNVRSGIVRPDGRLVTRFPLVRRAVTTDDIKAVLAGRSVSATHAIAGGTVFVEGRALRTGGVVIVQRRADATAPSQRALRSLALALLIAGLIAAAIGLLVARRVARPLRRTAAAAHAVAAGRRDVQLPADGPAEVVEVSQAVNHVAAALSHSEARQREFLLSVSHDLRTPLTAITGYAESLADGVIDPEDTVRVGGVMLGEARRLERLVGDLLDLARLDAQDFRVEAGPVDAGQLVRSAAYVWADRCAAAGVSFVLEAPEHPLWVHTDASRLRQALDGLFDNALRVTPAGAGIVLAARHEPGPAFDGRGTALVEVRDSGPGLSDDDLAVVFDQGALYRRYRGVREVGTGLGLAIVHGLVTRLGAHIEAGHAREGGARFTVRLPPLP